MAFPTQWTDNLDRFAIDSLLEAAPQQFESVLTASGLSTVVFNDKEEAVNWVVQFKRCDPYWSWDPTSQTAKLHCETVVNGVYKEHVLKEVVFHSDFPAPTQDWATATRTRLRAGFAAADKPRKPMPIEALVPLFGEKLLKAQTTLGNAMRFMDRATKTFKEPDFVSLHCDVRCGTKGGTSGSQSGSREAPKRTETVDASYCAYSWDSAPGDNVEAADWGVVAELTPKGEWEIEENPFRWNWPERRTHADQTL